MKARWGISVGLIVSLLGLALPWKVAAASALGEMIITGIATVNHIKAASGSTIFSGSEIETYNPGAAVISLSQGAGVLALEPNTLVNLSGSPQRLAAQVSKGTVTVRTKSPATIRTPQLQIESDPDSVYLVAVTRESTEVEALTRTVRVRANGESVTVKPGERYNSQTRSTTTAKAGTQKEKQENSKTKRRVLGIMIPLILGGIALPIALVAAQGEKQTPVSPTTPKP